jgi:hypothetical protein
MIYQYTIGGVEWTAQEVRLLDPKGYTPSGVLYVIVQVGDRSADLSVEAWRAVAPMLSALQDDPDSRDVAMSPDLQSLIRSQADQAIKALSRPFTFDDAQD